MGLYWLCDSKSAYSGKKPDPLASRQARKLEQNHWKLGLLAYQRLSVTIAFWDYIILITWVKTFSFQNILQQGTVALMYTHKLAI